MTEFINPLDILRKQKEAKAQEIATASTSATQTEGELATASALTNVDPSMCPKCGMKMGFGFLFDRTKVYYCPDDRVTQPME